MATINTPEQNSAQVRASLRAKKSKCVVCEGELEKSNAGMMCHSCKDRLSGKHSIPNADAASSKQKGQSVTADKIKLKKTRGVV
ncbi:MAG: hypothetical protein HY513_02215 [Candidatus Aenigmarchaeota archaeon]|nr:hypothetical protein [Candidatus Aenigmarchaeota archaeon]